MHYGMEFVGAPHDRTPCNRPRRRLRQRMRRAAQVRGRDRVILAAVFLQSARAIVRQSYRQSRKREMTRPTTVMAPCRCGPVLQGDRPAQMSRLRWRRTGLWGVVGGLSARRGLMTALLASFLALFVLVSVVEAATCQPESLSAPAAERIVDASSESGDAGRPDQYAICAHGHCHHNGLTVADISDMAAGPTPFREAMRVPGTVPLGSSGPDGLDRPPRG